MQALIPAEQRPQPRVGRVFFFCWLGFWRQELDSIGTCVRTQTLYAKDPTFTPWLSGATVARGIKNWNVSRVHDKVGNWGLSLLFFTFFPVFLFEIMSLALTGLSVMLLPVYPKH